MKLITLIFLFLSLNVRAQFGFYLNTNLLEEYEISLNDRFVEFVNLDSTIIYHIHQISDLTTNENILLDTTGVIRISINEDYPIFEIALSELQNGDTINLMMEKYYRVDTLTISSNCPGVKSEREILRINQDKKNYKDINSIQVKINSREVNFQVIQEDEIKITTGNCKGNTGFNKSVKTSQIILTNKKCS